MHGETFKHCTERVSNSAMFKGLSVGGVAGGKMAGFIINLYTTKRQMCYNSVRRFGVREDIFRYDGICKE